MIHNIYTVHDTKSAAYLQPFFLMTDGQALRAIEDCVNDPSHQFARHPADYNLFKIGAFDDETGKCDIYDTPFHMRKLLELVKDLSQPELFKTLKEVAS